MNHKYKAGSTRRLQKTTGENQIHKTSDRSAKAKARKTKTKRKPAVPESDTPLTGAAEILAALIDALNWHTLDEMCRLWEDIKPGVFTKDYRHNGSPHDGRDASEAYFYTPVAKSKPAGAKRAKRQATITPKSKARKSGSKGGRK